MAFNFQTSGLFWEYCENTQLSIRCASSFVRFSRQTGFVGSQAGWTTPSGRSEIEDSRMTCPEAIHMIRGSTLSPTYRRRSCRCHTGENYRSDGLLVEVLDSLLRDVRFRNLVGHPVGLVVGSRLLPRPAVVDVYLVRPLLAKFEFDAVRRLLARAGLEPSGRLECSLSRCVSREDLDSSSGDSRSAKFRLPSSRTMIIASMSVKHTIRHKDIPKTDRLRQYL